MRTFILYAPSEGPGHPISYDRLMQMDANKIYGDHFGNLMYLEFMLNHPETSRIEKDLAQKEIPIAQRKMAWWKRHPNWDVTLATRHTNRIRQQWKSKK